MAKVKANIGTWAFVSYLDLRQGPSSLCSLAALPVRRASMQKLGCSNASHATSAPSPTCRAWQLAILVPRGPTTTCLEQTAVSSAARGFSRTRRSQRPARNARSAATHPKRALACVRHVLRGARPQSQAPLTSRHANARVSCSRVNASFLGSPVVPFSLFVYFWFPYKVTNQKKGCPYYKMFTGLL